MLCDEDRILNSFFAFLPIDIRHTLSVFLEYLTPTRNHTASLQKNIFQLRVADSTNLDKLGLYRISRSCDSVLLLIKDKALLGVKGRNIRVSKKLTIEIISGTFSEMDPLDKDLVDYSYPGSNLASETSRFDAPIPSSDSPLSHLPMIALCSITLLGLTLQTSLNLDAVS